MWTLAIDCSDVQRMPSKFVFASADRLFDAYALRPLDRATKNRLRQAVTMGTATTFGKLLTNLGLVSAGGSTPARTRLDSSEICSTLDFAECGDGFTTLTWHSKQLSESRLEQCSPQHRAKFQGMRLMVARSLAQAIAVDFPLAVNSSMNVIHWNDTSNKLTASKRRAALSTLGRFLMSDFARYQFALFGRLWQVDRTRVERRDLDQVVVPLPEYFLRQKPGDEGSDEDFMTAMQIKDVSAAMRDYLNTRHQFENGLTPASANTRIVEVPVDYMAAMKSSLRSGFGPLFLDCTALPVLNASARIRIDVAEPLPAPPPNSDIAFQFYDSAHVSWSAGARQMFVVKPAGSLYFSLDRAYGDALRVMNLLLAAQ